MMLLPALLLASPPQRPSQPAPPAAQVSLNVVVLDAKGQNVADLTADDLQVQDNGKPQRIVAFRRQDSRKPEAAPLGPRQYSNRSATALPHATVILFDILNMRFEDRGYVFNQVNRALQQFESNESIFLYLITVNNKLVPVRGLPGDQSGSDAKERVGPQDIQARLNDAMHTTMGLRPVDMDIDTRVRATFATLSVMASRLAALPGRKNIVWLTHGVPISLGPNVTYSGDSVDYAPYIRQLSHTLDRADCSIYAVQQSPPGSTSLMGSDMGRSPTAETTGVTQPTGMGSEQTLTEFANLTGGRAYENNDIAGAIKQAVNDSKQSYLLTYAPPADNWDGKYHKVRVTSKRKGLRLQTRQGYYAFVDQAASGKQVQDAIEAAIVSPFDAADIGITAATSPLREEGKALHVALKIDGNDLQLLPSGDSYTGQLAIRVIEYQDDGTMRQTKPSTVNLQLTAAQHDEALKNGYSFTQDIALSPGASRIRVIVFDDENAAIGSLTIPTGK
ncbi:MAG TPA: VWA domain-containing protein [Candidatus Sulfopaludibacter sp.]|jgi:VWFA-related protein|nr:VWA domain-containing protein [Candidatus Sulfopaludibacter sp.]